MVLLKRLRLLVDNLPVAAFIGADTTDFLGPKKRPPRKAIRYYVLHGISEQFQNHRSEKSSEKTV